MTNTMDSLAGERDDEGSIAAAEVLPVCLLAVLLVSSKVLPAFYGAAGREYPAGLALLEQLAWGSAVWAWLYVYAARHRIALPVDAGWFALLAWWVLVPYCLFRARGRRGWGPILAFGVVWAAAHAVALIIAHTG
jgi:hypothetical protein